VLAVAPPWKVTVPLLTLTAPVPVAIWLALIAPGPANVVLWLAPVRLPARLRVVPASAAMVVAPVSVIVPESVLVPPTLWRAPAPPMPEPLTEMALVVADAAREFESGTGRNRRRARAEGSGVAGLHDAVVDEEAACERVGAAQD